MDKDCDASAERVTSVVPKCQGGRTVPTKMFCCDVFQAS